MRVISGVCVAILVAGLAHADLSPFVGQYRLASDHVVAITDWEVDPSAPHVLLFTDYRSGRIGVLREESPGELSLPTALMSGKEAVRLHLVRRAELAVALELREPGRTPRRAERLAIRSRDVAFPSDSASLHGTLWLPPGNGPFPAIVIVPAGRVGRTAAAPFTAFFVSEGFAVLAYDRRPSDAPFPTYADDAIAAARAIGRQPEVDPRRVGLWGHSQGGWLSLLAAARSRDVAFAIDHSGMLVPAWQQELYRIRAEALADSVPLATVEEAVAFTTRLMETGRTGRGWDEIAARLAVNPAPAWRELVYRPSSLAELQRIWRDDYSFDPRPFVAGIRQPILALFGGLDRSTPIESAAHLARAVAFPGSLEVAFFPTADHAFLDATTGGNAEIPRLSRFAPGMFDSLRSWLRRRAMARR